MTHADVISRIAGRLVPERVERLKRRVRDAMESPPVPWVCPARISETYAGEPLAVRKARAIALKLSRMPVDLWQDQFIAGSMTLEHPRLHAEKGLPAYAAEHEQREAEALGLSTKSVFGHVVPNYTALLEKGLSGIRSEVESQRANAEDDVQAAFLGSVAIALDAVTAFAGRLALRCETEAGGVAGEERATELRQMAANLRRVPDRPAQTFWQALQSVWLLHMIFHCTMNGNALGRPDQYLWPYLEHDLREGSIDLDQAADLVDCFCLKFNERAQTTVEQMPDARADDQPDVAQRARGGVSPIDPGLRTRHFYSSQTQTGRDSLDATNHWLQNVVIGGIRPDGSDGTNPMTYLLLESYRRNRMTNPVMTVRLHKGSSDSFVRSVCRVLKDGGGMPAMFNDEIIPKALEKIGIPAADARDYSNDGCWEVIIPGRTDFMFQRLSLMLCLEWALNRGVSRIDGQRHGPDTGDPRAFGSFEHVWQAFAKQLDAMIGRVVRHVTLSVDDRHRIAQVKAF